MTKYLFYEYFRLESAINLVGCRKVVARNLEEAMSLVEKDVNCNAKSMNAVTSSYRFVDVVEEGGMNHE